MPAALPEFGREPCDVYKRPSRVSGEIKVWHVPDLTQLLTISNDDPESPPHAFAVRVEITFCENSLAFRRSSPAIRNSVAFHLDWHR